MNGQAARAAGAVQIHHVVPVLEQVGDDRPAQLAAASGHRYSCHGPSITASGAHQPRHRGGTSVLNGGLAVPLSMIVSLLNQILAILRL